MSASAAMMMLPTVCSERSPPPSKRYSKTSASFLRPARATRQFLTSPGGATPSSCLSLPLEPPSSATVTTAVRSPTRSRKPRKSTGNPVPPPKATTLRSSYLLMNVEYIRFQAAGYRCHTRLTLHSRLWSVIPAQAGLHAHYGGLEFALLYSQYLATDSRVLAASLR